MGTKKKDTILPFRDNRITGWLAGSRNPIYRK